MTLVRLVSLAPWIVTAIAATSLAACTARQMMCATPGECPGTTECVAGRCQPPIGRPEILASVGDAGVVASTRLVVEPTEIAYVRRGDSAADGALPAFLTLGRARDGDAVVLLRFELPLATKARVIEAYVLLERSEAVDADPTPITLHLARVIEPWDAHSLSWALQPRLEGARAPSTLARGTTSARSFVRLDARAIVAGWKRHDPREHGVAIVAESSSDTGITFASGLFAVGASGVDSPGGSPTAPTATGLEAARGAGPRLEVYLK